MTETEEIVSYLTVQIYLHKQGIDGIGQLCIFFLDSLDEGCHLRCALRYAVGSTYQFVAVAHGIGKLRIRKDCLQGFGVYFRWHIFEVEGVDGRELTDFSIPPCHSLHLVLLLLFFLVFISHCYFLLFIAKH